jgi:putative phosphoribosyl transferase
MNQPFRFESREEAGRILAKKLFKYHDRDDLVILGLPRGGVPVAFVIARQLEKPLDIFLVSKITSPLQQELAIGAITSSGELIISKELVERLDITPIELDKIIESKKELLEHRAKLLRGSQRFTSLKDKTIILVDDGMATGSTMALAVASIKKLKPKKIIVAVPVASHEAIDHVKELADEVIVPLVPEFFYSVSMWFSDFRQTTDGEVIELLRQANKLKKANNRNGVAI